MKNTCKLEWRLPLIVSAFLLFSMQLIAQRDGEIPRYEGLVTYVNGMLKFTNQNAMMQVYNDLDQRIKVYNQIEESAYAAFEEGNEDNGVLAAFESQFSGYKSARKDFITLEGNLLEAGTDPGEIKESWISFDRTVGALVNGKNEFAVGNSIYWTPYEGYTYIITNGSIATLRAIQEGRNPFDFKEVEFFGPTGPTAECKANFSVNGNASGQNFSFVFTGSPTPVSNPQGTIKYHWTFGDGSSSELQNPSHTYSGTGTFEVCVKVEYFAKDSSYCMDRICQNIEIDAQDTTCWGAAAFLWNETGEVGKVCFTHVGNIYYNSQITSYSWSFGNGQTSTAQHPCANYPCDLNNVLVTLTVTLQNGCISSVTLPVKITSHNCCEKRPKVDGNAFYNNNQNKIEYTQKLYHFTFWHHAIAKMTNYKAKNGGGWKKDAGNLKIILEGDVYTENAPGCSCENDYDISNTNLVNNKKSLECKKNITNDAKTKKAWEWNAKYFVPHTQLVKNQKTTTACKN